MAYSIAAVTAHPDTHTIVASHVLETENLSLVFPPIWTGLGAALHGQVGGTNIVASENALVNAIDRAMVEDSRPNKANTDFYIVFRAAGTFGVVDTVALRIDNAAELGGVTATLETADSDDFTTPGVAPTVYNFGLISLNRRAVGVLANAYTGCQRFRLHLTHAAGVPQVSELWLGQRRNIPYAPKAPYDDQERASVLDVTDTKGGVQTIYARATRRRVGTLRFDFQNNTVRDTFRTIYDECDGFAKPFLLIDKPNTDASNAIIAVNAAGRIYQPVESWAQSARTVDIPYKESAPFRVKE